MAKKKKKLPPGVKLLRTLEGHQGTVYSVAFDPQGETLASGSDTVRAVREFPRPAEPDGVAL